MNVTLTNAAHCSVTLWNDLHKWDAPYEFASINDALAYAEEQIDVIQQALGATVYESDTGVVLAHCAWEDDSTPEEDYGAWEDWNYNEDMGFDPYLGCYTDDC